MLEVGKKYRVSDNHQAYPGQIGTFVFMGGVYEDVVVLMNIENNQKVYTCVGLEDIEGEIVEENPPTPNSNTTYGWCPMLLELADRLNIDYNYDGNDYTFYMDGYKTMFHKTTIDHIDTLEHFVKLYGNDKFNQGLNA